MRLTSKSLGTVELSSEKAPKIAKPLGPHLGASLCCLGVCLLRYIRCIAFGTPRAVSPGLLGAGYTLQRNGVTNMRLEALGVVPRASLCFCSNQLARFVGVVAPQLLRALHSPELCRPKFRPVRGSRESREGPKQAMSTTVLLSDFSTYVRRLIECLGVDCRLFVANCDDVSISISISPLYLGPYLSRGADREIGVDRKTDYDKTDISNISNMEA